MARGDVTVLIEANPSAGATWTRQPGSGVTEMMLYAAGRDVGGSIPNQYSAIIIRRIDGTNNEAIILSSGSGVMVNSWFNVKPIGDNTNYWQMENAGSTGDNSIGVVEVTAA